MSEHKQNYLSRPDRDTRHTPGPWVIQHYSSSTLESTDFYIEIDNELIAEFLTEANARLIAESPAMFEELEDKCDKCEQGFLGCYKGNTCETAAILKRVRGE